MPVGETGVADELTEAGDEVVDVPGLPVVHAPIIIAAPHVARAHENHLNDRFKDSPRARLTHWRPTRNR
jgi:hypothetical protein